MNPGSVNRIFYRLAAVLLCAAGLLSAPPAAAALGADLASVEADRAALEATALPAVAAIGYSIVELRAASGTVVREFLTAGGQVFGLAWSGPALPDLRQLLGAHFETYTSALRNQSRGLGRAEVREGDLVVQSAGQMRDFFGRAYLRTLLPQGVTPEDIQ